MSRDLEYRIALILIAAVHLAISQRQLRRAGAGASAAGPRAEGFWLAAGTGLFFLTFCATAALRLIAPDWLPWLELPLSGPLRWLGLALMSLGAALHLWGARHLGRNLTVTISTIEGHQLVTTGPYRWIRHPLYTGGMLESLGACLLLASGIVGASALAFWILIVVRTPREEARLLETFGADYTRYAKQVGRFLPRRIPPRIV
ncbi:MAG: isoprenylcysteine carboxylmethyltransferase family protein [Candidatus Hydrogenedentes bacterium]|nr:isoprenylcysteine carboxylmethyltransferase family protein [Candidatus Hydrogenedentota bacterium]